MTKRHDDIFDAVLSGVPATPKERDGKDRAGARFLKRGNAISERLSGEKEEKVLQWVDPATCRMWARHNRNYALLTEENCRDLIEGIRAQGQQEFPAVVRRLPAGEDHEFEVICGARRHFAVTWLRDNNYPQFSYLVEVRDLSDEEAFRLADIENRDREDISDYERASDYGLAIDLYYGGKQKAMAERLEVSEVWLSRYLELARLPSAVVLAYPTIRDLRESHARTLKPLLKSPESREKVLAKANEIVRQQNAARDGEGAFIDPQKVIAMLKSAGAPPPAKKAIAREFAGTGGRPIVHTRQGRKHRLEFPRDMSRKDLEAALEAFIAAEY